MTTEGSRRGPATPRTAWHVVVAASIATVMTAPGQTAAISVFTDPLIAELGISRNALSTSYLVGTLGGAAAMPLVGRALDRFGVGRVMAVIGAVFGAVLLALSLVSGIVGLTAGFVGIRMAGQGALGLAATTAVAVHVTHRRGLALGITSAVGSAGISLAPVFLERLISDVGIATAWRIEGLAVWLVVLPIALGVLGPARRTRRPVPAAEEPGTVEPGAAKPGAVEPAAEEPGAGKPGAVEPRSDVTHDDGRHGPPVGLPAWTAAEAVRTPMFWAIAAALAASGMLTTGLNFHQISALGEQGLTAGQAALNFVPQTVASLVSTLAIGALADKIAPKLGVAVAMLLLAGSLVMLPLVSPGWAAMLYGALLGAAGGSVRAVEAAAYAHYFGTTHIGGIRGIATTINVGSTAFGPLAMSLGRDMLGTYGATSVWLAGIPLAVAVAAVLVRAPRRDVRA